MVPGVGMFIIVGGVETVSSAVDFVLLVLLRNSFNRIESFVCRVNDNRPVEWLRPTRD